MGDFGNKFRKARESKELTFDAISNVIKINPRMLKAIEDENFDQLPGGVFNKGFIRAYAKHLGLNSDEAVNEYLACVRHAELEAQKAWEPPATEENSSKPSKTPVAPRAVGASSQPPIQVEELPHLHLPRAEDVRPARKAFIERSSPEIPWKLVAAAAVVVFLGIVLWARHSHSVRKESVANPQPSVPQAAVTTSSPPAAQSSSPTPQPPQPNAGASPAVPAASVEEKTEEKGDVTIRNFGKPLPKASENTAGALTLVVRASENSWISVVGDGNVIAEETLIAPANTTFHADKEFVIKVGNAAAVSFLINGKEVAPQGAEAEVKILTFDSSGLKANP